MSSKGPFAILASHNFRSHLRSSVVSLRSMASLLSAECDSCTRRFRLHEGQENFVQRLCQTTGFAPDQALGADRQAGALADLSPKDDRAAGRAASQR
jgi:hypothetical protein